MSWRNIAVVGLFCLAVLASVMLDPPRARAACESVPPTWYNPTGWEGCEAYGRGYASHWDGPGVAVNACVWPWRNCEPIRITALSTGITITVTPTMYCGCFYGTADARLVDLPPRAVRALGLNWADGLYAVRVTPAPAIDAAMLPDTAVETP